VCVGMTLPRCPSRRWLKLRNSSSKCKDAGIATPCRITLALYMDKNIVANVAYVHRTYSQAEAVMKMYQSAL